MTTALRFGVAGFLVAYASLAAAQYPSFDMITVVDAGDRQIKRFDGATGTYFGAFGRHTLVNPKGIAADLSRKGHVWVADDSPIEDYGRLYLFNAYTGALVNNIELFFDPTGVAATETRAFAAGTLNGGVTGRVQALNSSTKASAGLVDTIGGLYDAATTNVFVAVSAPNASEGRYWTYNGTSFTSETSFSGTSSGFGVQSNGAFMWVTGTNMVDLPNGIPITAPDILLANDVVGSTSGLFVVGSSSVVSGRGAISLYNPLSRDWTATFETEHLINPTYVTTLLAPEPGTMIALRLGALALALKRRKK